MKQKLLWLTYGLFCFGMLGIHCISPYALLLKKTSSDTAELKLLCSDTSIKTSPLIIQADSLYTASLNLIKEGNEEEGYLIMDLAFAYYQLILTRKQVVETMSLIKELENRLTNSKDELTNYQKILASLSTRSK